MELRDKRSNCRQLFLTARSEPRYHFALQIRHRHDMVDAVTVPYELHYRIPLSRQDAEKETSINKLPPSFSICIRSDRWYV